MFQQRSYTIAQKIKRYQFTLSKNNNIFLWKQCHIKWNAQFLLFRTDTIKTLEIDSAIYDSAVNQGIIFMSIVSKYRQFCGPVFKPRFGVTKWTETPRTHSAWTNPGAHIVHQNLGPYGGAGFRSEKWFLKFWLAPNSVQIAGPFSSPANGQGSAPWMSWGLSIC